MSPAVPRLLFASKSCFLLEFPIREMHAAEISVLFISVYNNLPLFKRKLALYARMPIEWSSGFASSIFYLFCKTRAVVFVVSWLFKEINNGFFLILLAELTRLISCYWQRSTARRGGSRKSYFHLLTCSARDIKRNQKDDTLFVHDASFQVAQFTWNSLERIQTSQSTLTRSAIPCIGCCGNTFLPPVPSKPFTDSRHSRRSQHNLR